MVFVHVNLKHSTVLASSSAQRTFTIFRSLRLYLAPSGLLVCFGRAATCGGDLAARKASKHTLPEACLILLLLATSARVLAGRPGKDGQIGFELFIRIGILNRLAVVQIFKPMCYAQVHHAFFTLEHVRWSKLLEAAGSLTMGGTSLLLVEAVGYGNFLVQLQLALACFDVLIPQVRRRYALFRYSLQP